MHSRNLNVYLNSRWFLFFGLFAFSPFRLFAFSQTIE